MTSIATFYDWSGGMESSAMLVVDRERIQETGAIVRWADTGKHFPEMYQSKAQIESILGLEVFTVPRRIDFDTYLLERGGMIRKGTNDCSRKMKRSNLSRHMRTFEKPWEVNLGYNVDEIRRRDKWLERNDRTWLHWRFPLIEHDIDRPETVEICRKAGFSVLVSMYEKMGRMDCYFCGNQRPSQAEKVVLYYPELAADWDRLETAKGHSFMPMYVREIAAATAAKEQLEGQHVQCSCFGEDDNFTQEEFEFGEVGE